MGDNFCDHVMFVSQGWQLLTTFFLTFAKVQLTYFKCIWVVHQILLTCILQTFLYVRILKSAIRQSHYVKGDTYLTFNKSVINSYQGFWIP